MKNEKLDNVISIAKKWAYKHDIISSCTLALIIGLAFGGVCTVLDWLFV